MKIKCLNCGYEYDDKLDKCPRCNQVKPLLGGCQNCSGCSLFKTCKIIKK